MNNLSHIKNSLALRLLRVVFSIYLCITVAITCFQMYTEYLLEERSVRDSFTISQDIFQDSLTKAAWDVENVQLSNIADGILKQASIVGIKIIAEDCNPIEKGQVRALATNNAEKNSSYTGLFEYSFNLIHGQKSIGKVTLYSSNQVVFDKVKLNFLVIIFNAVIKTIALWVLFIWAFQKFLTRQLDVFCQAMEEVDLDNQKNCLLDLETFNTYELSRIEYFFNDLVKRVIDSRDKLNELNKTLEEKVEIRTQQLFEKQQDLEKSNRELEEQIKIIEQLSITDELTELYNRRYFNTIFPKEIQRTAREKQTISFLIFDIDHFKQYNDNYGHQKGDSVLKTMGQLLKSQCQRGSDIPLRLGGEEFGIIFSCSNSSDALIFANKIRQAILNAQIPHEFSSVAKQVTASFGLITMQSTPGLSMDDLYKQADGALYQAKESGRNKIVQA